LIDFPAARLRPRRWGASRSTDYTDYTAAERRSNQGDWVSPFRSTDNTAAERRSNQGDWVSPPLQKGRLGDALLSIWLDIGRNWI